jgi:hypothetical protein
MYQSSMRDETSNTSMVPSSRMYLFAVLLLIITIGVAVPVCLIGVTE